LHVRSSWTTLTFMAPTHVANRRRQSVWPSVVGGFLAGSAIEAAPFLFITAQEYTSLYRLLVSAVICSLICSAGAVFVSRLLAYPDQLTEKRRFLSRFLLACAGGFFIVAIQCATLSVSNWATRDTQLAAQSDWLFSGQSVESLAIVCGASFLFSIVALAILAQRISRREWEDDKSEIYCGSVNALSRQRAARSENAAFTEQITERRRAEAELARLSARDPLTNLVNRSNLLGKLRAELIVAPSSPSSGKVLMYINLDRFRPVNDFLGYQTGDMLLKEIARRLQRWNREDNIVARLSSDEFAIFFQKIETAHQAKRMAGRILAAIEEPVNLNRIRFPITASIGICEINSRHHTPEDILRDADTAMHRAKLEGGNRPVFYDSVMYDESLSKIQTTLQLKSAIDNDEFDLYYQPFVNLKDNTIYGVEALIRWVHPKRGLLSAGEFISHAEDAGYSIAVGQWVLRRACRDFAAIREVMPGNMIMSVNVSNQQFEEASFLRELATMIESHKVDPHMLQLEIVESVFLRDAERVGALFSRIRSLGVRIALDDFGTGYSSLSYLHRFPIDTLKIDQSFIRGMQRNSLNSSIVKLLVNLAVNGGMTVLAEGVEDPEHVEVLLANGCEHAQGYLYSRPVPLDELLALLRRGLDAPLPGRPCSSHCLLASRR
jgi:diguanylate cyclase (GGDEF)-like protein